MSDTLHKRIPWFAGLLSLACTGLGHIYCGRPAKGIILFLLCFSYYPAMAAAMSGAPSQTGLWTICAVTAFVLGVFLYAIVNAVLLARRTGPGYAPVRWNRWYVYLLFILLGLVHIPVASLVRNTVAHPFKIVSVSMAPNFVPRDHIFAKPGAYSHEPVRRGDAVVFQPPEDERYFIKRVVALAGDTVAVTSGRLVLNGQALPYSDETPDANPEAVLVREHNADASYLVRLRLDPTVPDFPPMTVPAGHCFLLGDNRDASMDSRQFGPIRLEKVLGRVDYIYLPGHDWSRFGPVLNSP